MLLNYPKSAKKALLLLLLNGEGEGSSGLCGLNSSRTFFRNELLFSLKEPPFSRVGFCEGDRSSLEKEYMRSSTENRRFLFELGWIVFCSNIFNIKLKVNVHSLRYILV